MKTEKKHDDLIVQAGVLLLGAARLLSVVYDAETAAGRGGGDLAETLADAMAGLSFCCNCVSDLLPEPNRKNQTGDEKK